MSNPRIVFGISLTFGCLIAAPAIAADYDEAVSGDISGDRTVPTLFALDLGANALRAQSQSGDVEYFHATVPVGTQLTSISLEAYQSENTRAFIGVQQGSTFTVSPEAAAPGDMYGYTHFGIGQTPGFNLLGEMGTAFGAVGFVPPLPAGSYTFWTQQTDPIPTAYTLSFGVADVPEPALAAALHAAAAPALLRHRRRARHPRGN
jgi:hypothetical protein